MADFISKISDWLTGAGEQRKAREKAQEIANQANATQGQYTKEAMAEYMKYLDKALASSDTGRNQALAATLAGGQAGLDLARQGAMQEMSWRLPTQAASLSALQALPQMQALMGMPAYNIPTTIDTSAPGRVDLAGLYQNALAGQGGAGSVGGSSVGGATGGTSQFALTPYTGKTMDISASPMFKWQQQQMQENVNRGLAARGYGSSPAGAAILADEYSKLLGSETDKTYNRLASMVGMGAGMPGATGGAAVGTQMANIPGNVASNLSNLYNQSAQQRAGLYEGAGTTMASSLSALGSQAGALGQQQAGLALGSAGPSPLSTIMDIYGMYSGYKGLQNGNFANAVAR
jgi:hypothetical protein